MGTLVGRSLIYSWLTAISVLLAIVGWGRAAAEREVTSFAEIDVQRINVREPDGTLRMTISNSATAPGLTVSRAQSLDLVRRFATATFDDVRVPAASAVGSGEETEAAVGRQLQTAVALQCAELAGAASQPTPGLVEMKG